MKKGLYLLLLFISLPIILNLYELISTLIKDIGLLDYFLKQSTIKLIGNSILLSLVVTLISAIFGIGLAIAYFRLSTFEKKLYLLVLFLFFSIQPIIYLSAFKDISLFNLLSPFWQSIFIVSFPMVAFWTLIYIFLLSGINYGSIRVALMVASKRNTLRYILKPQLIFALFLSSCMVFILTFSNSEVPSILGYRTYAEDFLAQISLMDSIAQISVATIPFYFLATLFLVVIGFFIKRYHIKFQLREWRESLDIKRSRKIFIVLGFLFVVLVTLLISKIEFRDISTLLQDNIWLFFNSISISLVIALTTLIFSIIIYNYLLSPYITVTLLLLIFLTPSALIGLEMIEIMQYLDIQSEVTSFIFFILSGALKLIPIGVTLIYILSYKDIRDESLALFPISKLNIFLKIKFPIYRLRWFLTLIILLIFALNELSISILLIPIGFDLIIIKIYNLLHYGDYSSVTFLSLVQIGIVGVLIYILERFSR